MLDFILPVVAGVAVASAWFGLWAISLQTFGIPVLQRDPKELGARKERLLAMGKWRYVLIFGVLGGGLGFGLGTVVANMIASPHFRSWSHAAAQLVLSMVFFGLWSGITTWQSFRGEVPFPPDYPPQK